MLAHRRQPGNDQKEEGLRDARFLVTKQELIKKHRWKLVDIDPGTRIPRERDPKAIEKKCVLQPGGAHRGAKEKV